MNRLAAFIGGLFKAKRCADCGAQIGKDKGPKDGWQLEDGRTVCHACCGADFLGFADTLKSANGR
jgi:hypothetical protein